MKTKKIIPAIIASLIIIFIIAACSKSKTTSQAPAGNTTNINISGMAFPATTSVKAGSTVIWANKDSYAHTVTSDDNTSFSSGNIAGGASFSFKTTVAGSFAYHCNIHSNMHGTLVVTP